jgi:hypothetical protein
MAGSRRLPDARAVTQSANTVDKTLVVFVSTYENPNSPLPPYLAGVATMRIITSPALK